MGTLSPRLGRDRPGHAGQPERVILFAIGEHAGVPGELAAEKFHRQEAVEIGPWKRRFCFTIEYAMTEPPASPQCIDSYITIVIRGE